MFPAVVEALAGRYVIVRYDGPEVFAGKADQFYAGSGWRAWDGLFCWRLMPVPDDESAATAGEEGER